MGESEVLAVFRAAALQAEIQQAADVLQPRATAIIAPSFVLAATRESTVDECSWYTTASACACAMAARASGSMPAVGTIMATLAAACAFGVLRRKPVAGQALAVLGKGAVVQAAYAVGLQVFRHLQHFGGQ